MNTDQDETEQEKREDLLRDIFEDFSEAMAVVMTPEEEDDSFETRATSWLDELEFHYLEKIPRSNLWEDERRSLAAIRQAFVDGSVVLRTEHDTSTILFILETRFVPLYPEIVEYYIRSGEFLEVASHVRVIFEGLWDRFGPEGNPVIVMSKKLIELHEYDLNREKDLEEGADEEGDDENFVLQLPLDIRMSFSGLFNDE